MKAEIKSDGTCWIEGKKVSREEFDKSLPSCLDLTSSAECLMGHTTTCWPMLSEALAVHPTQIEQAMARNKRHGVNVTYTRDGRAILPDRGERKRLLRLEGFHDNQAGFGD